MFSITINANTLTELKKNLTNVLTELTGDELYQCSDNVKRYTEQVINNITDEQVKRTSDIVFPFVKGINSAINDPEVIPDADSRGLPWDSRIHSSSKETVKNGEWKKRRGVDANLVSQVEAELIGNLKTSHVEVPPVPMNTPDPVVVPAPAQPLSTPTPITLTPPELNDGSYTYEQFKAKAPFIFNDLIKSGKIDKTYIDSLKEFFSVSDIWSVFKDEVKGRELYSNLADFGLIKKA